MNVWIVNHYAIPPSMGGLVRHFYFSKYLQKKGHSVKIFTSSKIHNTDINLINDKSLFKEKKFDDVEYTFVRSRNYKGNGMGRILNLIDMPFKMRRAMKHFWTKEKPDIIYTSSPDIFVAFFAVLFGKSHKLPVVLEIRDLWPESIVEYKNMSKKNPIIIALYMLEKWIYKKSDRIIFTFEGGRDYIRDKKWDKKIEVSKVRHVNNGVDLEEFEYNRQVYRTEDYDLVNPDTFKIIYVGSIRLVNHLQDVVNASKLLKKRNVDRIEILIYGNGTEKEALEKECRELDLPVKFKGWVEKKYIPYILSCADLNLINIQYSNLVKYGCSWNKLFEYIAAERPILCNLPTSYDLILKNGLGVSKVFSPEQYADSMVDFADMPEEEYSAYCSRFADVKKEFDYKKLADKLENIFEELV